MKIHTPGLTYIYFLVVLHLWGLLATLNLYHPSATQLRVLLYRVVSAKIERLICGSLYTDALQDAVKESK